MDRASYTYRSGAARWIGAKGRERVRKGGEIELTESEVIDLTQRGILLEPVDGRRKLPDPPQQNEPVTIETVREETAKKSATKDKSD